MRASSFAARSATVMIRYSNVSLMYGGIRVTRIALCSVASHRNTSVGSKTVFLRSDSETSNEIGDSHGQRATDNHSCGGLQRVYAAEIGTPAPSHTQRDQDSSERDNKPRRCRGQQHRQQWQQRTKNERGCR